MPNNKVKSNKNNTKKVATATPTTGNATATSATVMAGKTPTFAQKTAAEMLKSAKQPATAKNCEDSPQATVNDLPQTLSNAVKNEKLESTIHNDTKNENEKTNQNPKNNHHEKMKMPENSQQNLNLAERDSKVVNSSASCNTTQNLVTSSNSKPENDDSESPIDVPVNSGVWRRKGASISEKNYVIKGNTTQKQTALKYPRAQNPQMSVKDRVSSEPRDVRISKALAAVLRHGKMEIQLDSSGYALVDEIVDHVYFKNLNVTLEDIQRVTHSPIDNVQRFILTQIPTSKNENSDAPKKFKVRATDGHTIVLHDTNFRPLEIDETAYIPFAIHGTYWKAWETIRNNGLKRTKQKKYINLQPGHLSGDGSKLTDLVKKFKNNCEVLVYIDLARAISEGIKFFKTGSGMVVTTGDHNQKIPPRYFLKAVHISPTTGDQIWIESLGNHDIVNTNEIISGLENMGGPNLAEYQNFQDTYANSNSNYSGDSDNNSDYVGRTKQLLFKAKAPVNQTHSLQTGMFNSTSNPHLNQIGNMNSGSNNQLNLIKKSDRMRNASFHSGVSELNVNASLFVPKSQRLRMESVGNGNRA